MEAQDFKDPEGAEVTKQGSIFLTLDAAAINLEMSEREVDQNDHRQN